jgi:ankyrin repeat protein
MQAAELADPSIVEVLLEAGADPNISDEEGRTPLMTVGSAGEWQTRIVVELLLKAGAGKRAVAKNGLTAQKWFAYLGRDDILKMLEGAR